MTTTMVINSGERKPEVITLSNGIRVVFDVDKGHPTAAVGALVASGSRFEDEHTRGLSHFMEHILFKGTEHRSSLEISSAIENVGGELNAFTDTQYTMFYMRVPRIHTSLALDVLSDILLYPLFDPAAIELERRVIEQEIYSFEDSPDDVVTDELLKGVYGSDPVASNPLGTVESVRSFRRSDFVDYFHRHFVAPDIVLSLAGDIDVEASARFLEDSFGRLAKGPGRAEWGIPVRAAVCRETERPTEQVYMAMALPGFAQYSKTGVDSESRLQYLRGQHVESPVPEGPREGGSCLQYWLFPRGFQQYWIAGRFGRKFPRERFACPAGHPRGDREHAAGQDQHG